MNPAMLAALMRTVGAAAMTAVSGRNQQQSPANTGSTSTGGGLMLTLSQLLTYLLQQQRAANQQQPPGNRPPSPQGQSPPPPQQPPGSQPPSPGNQPPSSQNGLQGFLASLSNGAGVVARAVLPFAKIAAAAVAAVKGLELMNMGVLALNRDLAQFNGQLAAAYAQYDVGEIQRGVAKGESLAGPLSELAAAQNELRDSTSQVSNQVQGLTIGVMAKITEAVNWLNKAVGITTTIAAGLEAIRNILPWGKGAEPGTGPWQTFFSDVQDGKFDGKRPTFSGPKNLHNDQDMKDIFG